MCISLWEDKGKGISRSLWLLLHGGHSSNHGGALDVGHDDLEDILDLIGIHLDRNRHLLSPEEHIERLLLGIGDGDKGRSVAAGAALTERRAGAAAGLGSDRSLLFGLGVNQDDVFPPDDGVLGRGIGVTGVAATGGQTLRGAMVGGLEGAQFHPPHTVDVGLVDEELGVANLPKSKKEKKGF